MIVIVDYGVGNPKSVYNMLLKTGAKCKVSDKVHDIKIADKLILPGVGNFGHGVKNLRSKSLLGELSEFVTVLKKPILGICLGAQIFGKGSEEAPNDSGLGWIDMYCRSFPKFKNLRMPNMGWNQIELARDCPILSEQEPESRYYFVHSYYMDCKNKQDVVAYAEYGIRFASVIYKENIIGMQFHPEKSHRYGLKVMRNFNLM